MIRRVPRTACFASLVTLLSTASGVLANDEPRNALPSGSGGVLFSSRFEAEPFNRAEGFSLTERGGVAGTVTVADEGTIDAYMQSPTASLKMILDTRNADAKNEVAGVSTPLCSVTNHESELGKLTVGVDLWVSHLRPVRLIVSSFAGDGTKSGSLSKTLIPPVAGAYYRFTPSLADFSPAGGTFDAIASKINFTFEVAAEDLPLEGPQFVLKADNLSYAAPAYYVSTRGDDLADGRSESTAFQTIQRAIDVANAGDVILVLGGEYFGPATEGSVTIDKAGSPDRWIVLRAAPHSKPVLRATGWNTVVLTHNAAYVEIRGLTTQGYTPDISLAEAQADGDIVTKDDKRYVGDPRMNTNGISVDARKGEQAGGRSHHIRFIDNTVRDQPGGGLSIISADHATVEGNLIVNNCHRMRYGGSGVSLLNAWNFDSDPGYRHFVINNRVIGNGTDVKWAKIGKISDGNGIIIDQFIDYSYETNTYSPYPFTGRTLVQNNLVVGNGGSGIHAFASNHVDIANNTAYFNAQSPELNWRQIFASSKCRDIRIVNNILWAQRGRPVHTKMGDSKDVVYANNLMFGEGQNGLDESGGLGTASGGADAQVVHPVSGNPMFVNPSLDPATMDFRLKAGSPAIGSGTRDFSGVPLIDQAAQFRAGRNKVTLGALEYQAESKLR